MTAVLEQRTSSVNRINPDAFPVEGVPVFPAFTAITSSETGATWSRSADTALTASETNPCNGIIRFYEPVTGRWLSNDPIGIAGGMNQYVFCANNPVNFRDSLGLCRNEPNIFGIGSLPPGFPYIQPSSPWLNVPASIANTFPFAANVMMQAFAGAINTFAIDPNSPTAPIQTVLALTGVGAGASGVLGQSGPVFGRFGAGALNNNPVLRVGWGWKGSATVGQQVFRIAWGSKGSWIHGHIDIWSPF